jgi:iron complex outermembrane receptor protein
MNAQRTISGTIYDSSNNDALIGANVLVQGTTIGTITDIDGSFSLNVPAGNDKLVVSFTGYDDQVIMLGESSNYTINLSQGKLLDEIVVVGYGTQSEKEITSAVTKVDAEDFNQGAITDPAQLLQGKVAGLQVNNRGGDPNGNSTIRLRGISTVGSNVEPLVVVDGIIGASLDNVDPNDIESISVLKDGSAAAIYGSRGSSGVILVTTKSGNSNENFQISYNGQLSTSSAISGVPVMTAEEFVAAGGTDLGSNTDWLDEVTRSGFSNLHGISASGGVDNSTFRISANFRDVNGILRNSGFDQFNTRVNLSTRALNDKLKIDFNSSFTNRNQQNGFVEALRYAVLYNPTAPVLGENAPFAFNSDQFGGFFETLGLFDSFNPVSLIEQNRNDGTRREFNYGATATYSFTDNLSGTFRVAQQKTDFSNISYYPTTSLFRGNATSPIRKGLAEFYQQDVTFNLYEGYMTYTTGFGSSALTLTGGYSYQEDTFDENFFSLGDFPDNSLDFSNLIQTSQDLQAAGFIGASSGASPTNKIIAFFGRANLTLNDNIFFNASLRREGSSKLGTEEKWGLFPSLSAGIDISDYMGLDNVDLFKVRLGYGVTGALPQQSGLSQPIRAVVNGADGSVTTDLIRAGNDSLRWERKSEINFGVEFQSGRFSSTLDLYTRDISDFILERTVDPAVFVVNRRFENVGELNTRGVELALNYDVVQGSDFNYTTGVILSTYRTKLNEYVLDAETRANLGAPGQNGTNMILVREGEEIGNIWGPVFESVAEDGSPVFSDLNNDGMLLTDQALALDSLVDFAVLGNGIPDLTFGWTNQISFKGWNINAFFRGAIGHSLVNTFRAFYEPQLSTQSSYNFVNTDLAVDGLTSARFSSLYVEKADFIRLDNLTISRSVNIPGNSIRNATVSLNLQNPFVITSYTGTDPEPSLVDSGAADNGNRDFINVSDVLSPGIERRNSYFASRSVTLGINLNF